ncbi:MAG: glycosyltransferase [Microcoleus sp. PH2017_10_PVI_O_A]|uniref:glycosyltransferase n=1 Tax=unclassified Microcoleus TaxID=2642155 RepID=UPI001DA27509|nr:MULTISPECIES: glycosyltransferase [unclassified Microcoleus]TAE84881.1 MAG: glycosyltransferase [Oscillatoriales cyanobacterium]MCC3404129.1 glycosyltransferase [Microcoleus sp. PH2017_10_PVI_O_A]MCC3458213.1 glycosyltransferase [Microcoleus sp. PH2017_11_PCY_U_A]MCC3476700.1 glycosyltransferase [Microcoleus sp. PH2017_12_PCY_D_A]MCC3529532.1 glycosyltransferase [Microcoleus sp. PH2017_21_RUC_O_A]
MNSAEFLPLVSVVVPVYNGEKDLPDLIECLRSQTYPTNRVEYLLVDNKSRDYTSTILQAAAKSPNQEGFNQITLRNLSENTIQSSYAARNKGIRASTGEIIAFTDADCRPEPQWLQNLVQPFANLDIGITCGEILALPGNTLLEKHAARENTLSQKHTLAHPFCPYGQTANLAVRRQILARVGLFRPYLTSGGDADLCWRILRETSYKIYFAESAIARHRHRSTIKQLQSQWHRYGESNKYLHELHGVDLMREFKIREYFYRLARWLLKELPVAAAKCAIARADLVDLLNTPIGLLNVRARAIGQRQAKLPELAREIERL